jgi:predicted nucleotidyltransferase
MKTGEKYGLPIQVVEQLKHIFRSEPRISKVILFGSRAKGNYRNGSDIDLCIEANTLTLFDLLKLSDAIEELYLPWKVDLVLAHTIDNPELLKHTQRVGLEFFSSVDDTMSKL